MRLWIVIAAAVTVASSGRGIESGPARLSLQDGNGKLRVGNVLIVCKIVAGLGEVGWTLNIRSEIERISNGKVTTVFYGAHEGAAEFLERFVNGEYVDRPEDLGEKGAGRGGIYICRKRMSNKEINDLRGEYGAVITFRVLRVPLLDGDERLSREIIDVMEYGSRWRGGVKMFFKDYNELYGSGVEENEGYVRVCESPSEFKTRLGDRGVREFREDYIRKLIPSEEYYFTYFAYVSKSLDSKMSLLKFACRRLYDFTRRTEIVKEPGGLGDFIGRMQKFMRRVGVMRPRSSKRSVTVLTNLDIRKCGKEEFLKKGNGSGERKEYIMNDVDKAMVMRILWDEYGVTEGECESILYLYIKDIDLRVKLVHYSQLSPSEFEYALLRSERVAGCTGDMSLSQVLSSGRVPIYECLEHNRNFLGSLVRWWGKTTGQESPENIFEVLVGWKRGVKQWTVGCLKYYREFWPDYRKFIDALRKDSFQKWLYNEVVRIMVMKRVGVLKIDSELEGKMISVPFDKYDKDLKVMDESMEGSIRKTIEKLSLRKNDIGVCLLQHQKLSSSELRGVRIGRLVECIEEVITELEMIDIKGIIDWSSRDMEESNRKAEDMMKLRCRVVGGLSSYLDVIGWEEARLGRIFQETDVEAWNSHGP